MAIPPSPKVVFEEVDMTRMAGSGTPNNLLIAGIAPKGSLEPQIITSPANFVEVYGTNPDSNFYWAGNLITQFGSVLAVRAVGSLARCGGVIFNVDEGVSGADPTDVLPAGVVDPTAVVVTATDQIFHIYAENPGIWCNSEIKVATLTYADYDLVNFRVNNPPMAADEFLVVVTDTSDVVLEYFRVSRITTKRDSYGSIYLEDRINGNSKYIWVVDNNTLDNTHMPMSTIIGSALDPVNLTKGVLDNSPTAGQVLAAYQKCRNTALFDFAGILSVGNVGSMTDLALPQGLISLAEEVRTRLFLDNPFDVDNINDLVEYREQNLNCSSNRVMLYFDWQQAYDAALDKYRYVPPTVFVGAAVAYMVNPNTGGGGKLWNAPAGNDFGKIWNATSSRYDPTEVERDTLYSHQINSLATIPGLGRLIWGDKTQQKFRSALSYYGPRTALDIIETEIKRVGQSFLFKPNIKSTRDMFAAAVNPFLRSMYADGALNSYIPINVSDAIQVMPEVLNAILKVELTEPVEAITIQVQIINQQSVTVTEL
jgi:phage tail sheath protein FI